MVAVRAKFAGVPMAISRENRCSESKKVLARFAILEYRREVLARFVAHIHSSGMFQLFIIPAPLPLSLEGVNDSPCVAAQHGLLDLVLGDVDGLLAGFVGDGGQVRPASQMFVNRLRRHAKHLGSEVDFSASRL